MNMISTERIILAGRVENHTNRVKYEMLSLPDSGTLEYVLNKCPYYDHETAEIHAQQKNIGDQKTYQ
ncbi:hypothetical protein CHS0354_005806, partial [Potamilus streckersoni]